MNFFKKKQDPPKDPNRYCRIHGCRMVPEGASNTVYYDTYTGQPCRDYDPSLYCPKRAANSRCTYYSKHPIKLYLTQETENNCS